MCFSTSMLQTTKVLTFLYTLLITALCKFSSTRSLNYVENHFVYIIFAKDTLTKKTHYIHTLQKLKLL